MYTILISLHSIFRWLVALSLTYGIYRGYRGYTMNTQFSHLDNSVRHWTATIAHIQLVLGMTLYTQSPVTKYFWKNKKIATDFFDAIFYAVLHSAGMLTAIVLITIGSAMAKRKANDKEKFKTMFIWFTFAFIIIFIFIPWPFSPLSKRPFLR